MSIDMGKHFRGVDLLKYTAPSIAMMVFASTYSVVDGLFISNFVGKTAFAAVNWAMPLLMILGCVGFMVGTGGSAIVAKTRGEGEDLRANCYFSLLIYAALVLGILLTCVGFVLLRPVCEAMGAQGEMLDQCLTYGSILLFSTPAFVLQYMFQSFFVTAGKPQLGLFVTVAAGVTNMVLDALFIAVFKWGVAGAAIATASSEVVGGVLPLIYFARKNSSFLQLGQTRFELRVLGRACINGSSEMVANIAMSLVGMLYNFQLLRLIGEDGVAAYGIIMYLGYAFAAVFMGYSMGSAPLMSFQFGAKNKPEMRSLFRKSLFFIACGGAVMFVLAQICAPLLASIFAGYDADFNEMTQQALRIYSLAYLFMGFGIYASALFTALNNGLVSAVISSLRTFVFEAGCVLLLPVLIGAWGVWFAAPVAEFASFLIAVVFVGALGKTYGLLKPCKKTK